MLKTNKSAKWHCCRHPHSVMLKIKLKVTKMKPIYDFLFMYNSNYVPNLHRFHVIGTFRPQNGHLTLTFVLKVKFKVTKMKPICDFLLLYNSNYVPNLYWLHVTATLTSVYMSITNLICIF